jgi:hypothetical protein
MSRPLVSAVVLVALAALAGCASSSQQGVSHSLASQVPTEHVAYAPPSDFEFEFAPKETGSTRHATKDAAIAGSLRAASPTARTTEE